MVSKVRDSLPQPKEVPCSASGNSKMEHKLSILEQFAEVLASCGSVPETTEWRKRYSFATKYLAVGDFGSALSEYYAAIQTDPGKVEAYIGFAKAFRALDRETSQGAQMLTDVLSLIFFAIQPQLAALPMGSTPQPERGIPVRVEPEQADHQATQTVQESRRTEAAESAISWAVKQQTLRFCGTGSITRGARISPTQYSPRESPALERMRSGTAGICGVSPSRPV